ncbi:hypothetical protein ES708_26606 [subsurface metagenome]
MSKRKPKEADNKVSAPEMDKQAIDVEEKQEAETADTPGSDMSNGNHAEEPDIVRELQEHSRELVEESSCLKDQRDKRDNALPPRDKRDYLRGWSLAGVYP